MRVVCDVRAHAIRSRCVWRAEGREVRKAMWKAWHDVVCVAWRNIMNVARRHIPSAPLIEDWTSGISSEAVTACAYAAGEYGSGSLSL